MKTYIEFVKEIMPLLLNRTVTKIKHEVVEGSVSAYWVGTSVRIDLKIKGGVK